MELPLWLRVAESLAAVATPILIAVGGFFAWYKLIRRGEHDTRLQPAVSGRTFVREGVVYIIVEARVQNSGQVDVDLRGGISAVEISMRAIGDDEWQYVTIARVFEDQEILQPGETIEDKLWFELQYDRQVAIRLDLTVAPSESRSYPSTEIISLFSED